MNDDQMKPVRIEQGKQIMMKVTRIQVLKRRIAADIAELLSQCVSLAPMFDAVKDGNTSRLGWWFKNFADGISLDEVRKYRSIASRTKDVLSVESWQLRLLGIISAVHHRDKPISADRTKRHTKKKSWVYHVGKTQDGIESTLRKVGGTRGLTQTEKDQIREQLGPIEELLKRLKS